MLIAEIGNCHLGDTRKFMELIVAAFNSGADAVKSQAFSARDIRTGSMPLEFYAQCELPIETHREMIHWARDVVGIELFYSIFSREMLPLQQDQKYHKLSGSQVRDYGVERIEDRANLFASVPLDCFVQGWDLLRHTRLLYVTQYGDDAPMLEPMKRLAAIHGKPVGLSDHTAGVSTAINAITHYGANAVEKHFTLKHDLKFKGQVFRDTAFGATPSELEAIATAMKSKGGSR